MGLTFRSLTPADGALTGRTRRVFYLDQESLDLARAFQQHSLRFQVSAPAIDTQRRPDHSPGIVGLFVYSQADTQRPGGSTAFGRFVENHLIKILRAGLGIAAVD